MSDSQSTVTENDCLRRVMVLMMAADDEVDPDEVTTIIRVYKETTGEDITAEALQSEADALPEGMKLGECAGQLAQELDEQARLRVLGAAFAVAAADGFVVEEEDEMLVRLASDLEIAKPAFEAAIQKFLGR